MRLSMGFTARKGIGMPDMDEPGIEKSEQLQHDASHEMMTCAMEHYLIHHNVVLRKLQHAQAATRQSLDEIDEIRKSATLCQDSVGSDIQDEINSDMDELREDVERYDSLWVTIIQEFRSSGMPEDSLDKIEIVLSTIPKIIRKFYDALINADTELQGWLKKMASEKYKQALEFIDKLQAKPNPMSGLGAEEYDPEETVDNAYIFKAVLIS